MWIVVVALVVGLCSFFYSWNTRNYSMFSKHGIFEPRKTFPFGSDCNWDVMLGRKPLFVSLDETYKQTKQHPVVGVFNNSSPVLIVNDLEMAKTILIKDFDHFEDRRSFEFDHTTEPNKIAANMLTILTGEKWKKARTMMSPAFTSGKLKAMNPLINKVGADLTNYLNELADKKEEFSAKEVMTSYTLDSIASCGFGVEANSFKDPDGVFRKMVTKATGAQKTLMIRFMLSIVAPQLMKTLKLSLFDEESLLFFADVVRKAVKHRRETKVKRGDLIDLVLEALEDNASEATKAKEDDQFEKDAEVKTDYTLSPDEIELLLVSIAVILFFAGFDTSSTSLSMTLAFLARHPDIQEKLYQEINDTFEANVTQDLDYYTIQQMQYLDMVFMETLRFYFTGQLERVCNKDYELPNSTFVVPKGMLIQVPSSAIHKESEYYPDPDHFNPDANWSHEAKAARSPYSFMSFGQGPRNCIGMRFALIMSKMALIRVVGNFKVSEGPRMPKDFVISAAGFNGMPVGGVWCKVEKRSSAV